MDLVSFQMSNGVFACIHIHYLNSFFLAKEPVYGITLNLTWPSPTIQCKRKIIRFTKVKPLIFPSSKATIRANKFQKMENYITWNRCAQIQLITVKTAWTTKYDWMNAQLNVISLPILIRISGTLYAPL